MTDSLPEDPAHPIYTAHHEAGHVLANLVCTQGFNYVTIRPDKETPHHLGMLQKDEITVPVEIAGTMTAAGPTAETYLRHVGGAHGYQGLGSEALVASVRTVCRRGHTELREAQQVFPGSIDAAADLVVRHWPTVEALAAALLDAETLSFAECFEVADQSGLYDRLADY